VTLITRRQQTLPSQATKHSTDGRDPARLHPRFISFCGDRADLSDVAAMCQSKAASSPLARTTARDRIVKGFVYLKRYGKSGRDWKIGKTEVVRRRHAQLESMYPGELRHSHSIPTDDPTKGSRGEIFRLDPADVRAFRSRDYQ
jgi:hypothetical protein